MPSVTFNFTGGWQKWVVPAGVQKVDVNVRGAGSGSNNGGNVAGKMSVNPGQELWIQVGRQGRTRSGNSGGEDAWGGGGAGGDGKGSAPQGGNGGGGASAIRTGNYDGAIKVVAGGAGGNSGDGGKGGDGGANNGQDGQRGSAGTGNTTNAQGGSQTKGGTGGSSSSGGWYVGQDAPDGRLAQGGKGASPNRPKADGGGGGGGGYHAGGGGNGSAPGFAPGGGGGGGSNYTGDLTQVTNERGGGTTGDGRVVITWTSPVVDTVNPPPPTNLMIDGNALDTETATRVLNSSVNLYADTSESDDRTLILIAHLARNPDFSDAVAFYSRTPFAPGSTSYVLLTGLAPATLYHVRMWTQDDKGNISLSYSEASFWTNRPPGPPILNTPSDNRQFIVTDAIDFTWTPTDPDAPDVMAGWEIRWRPIVLVGRPQPDWSRPIGRSGGGAEYVASPLTFKGNTFYEWQVRTQDSSLQWGDWSQANSFYVLSPTQPPDLLFPVHDEAAIGEQPIAFQWKFQDPTNASAQTKADLRWRVAGTSDWITRIGDTGFPGSANSWTLPQGTFIPGYHYEWEVRTYNLAAAVSEWSPSAFFWATEQPGQGVNLVVGPEPRPEMPPLGCGDNRVFVYDRGGEVRRGEITQIAQIQYGRKRDDISSCTIILNGFGRDCGEMLASLRTWQHELVVFRDGKRVWEGPITRIDLGVNDATIDAKDVLVWTQRRIMRQGYNDTARYVPATGQVEGGYSVVKRAASIVMNALAYDDPNILKWMVALENPGDATEHRAVADFTKLAWEEIDDMAAHAGLDYTTAGRRIMFWDTHRPIGRLPEMRDGDFSEPPRITEYGMQLANLLATTTGTGIYATSERGIITNPDGSQTPQFYGWVEQLISAYGDTETVDPDTLTQAAKADLEQSLSAQSDRNIAGRWPAPLVVRVPDNANLNPDIQLSFDHLVPGVWIPVRSIGTLREVAQWQKLDSVTVVQNADSGEKISVIMSPAPNGGEDPDDVGSEDDS